MWWNNWSCAFMCPSALSSSALCFSPIFPVSPPEFFLPIPLLFRAPLALVAQCGFYGIWFLISGKRGTYHTHTRTHTGAQGRLWKGGRGRRRRTCSPFLVKRFLSVFGRLLFSYFFPPLFTLFPYFPTGGGWKHWQGLYCCCFPCECASVCLFVCVLVDFSRLTWIK